MTQVPEHAINQVVDCIMESHAAHPDITAFVLVASAEEKAAVAAAMAASHPGVPHHIHIVSASHDAAYLQGLIQRLGELHEYVASLPDAREAPILLSESAIADAEALRAYLRCRFPERKARILVMTAEQEIAMRKLKSSAEREAYVKKLLREQRNAAKRRGM